MQLFSGTTVSGTSLCEARLDVAHPRRYHHFTAGRAAFSCGSSSRPSFLQVCVVFLHYLDESGNYESHDEHFVVGGVAIHEGDVARLRQVVRDIKARHLHEHLHSVEIHAQHMRLGKGAWRSVPRNVRHELLRDLSSLLGEFRKSARHPFALFATVRSPGAVPTANPLQRTFEEQFLRFNEMLRRLGDTGDEPRGMVVADKARYERTLQPIARRWREEGTRFKRLDRLLEVPLFVDSSITVLIQLADLVAHATYLAYARNSWELHDRMLHGFDEADGVIHGLVHLTPTHHSCLCLACVTRRKRR